MRCSFSSRAKRCLSSTKSVSIFFKTRVSREFKRGFCRFWQTLFETQQLLHTTMTDRSGSKVLKKTVQNSLMSRWQITGNSRHFILKAYTKSLAKRNFLSLFDDITELNLLMVYDKGAMQKRNKRFRERLSTIFFEIIKQKQCKYANLQLLQRA